jgi:hypothetical protein
MTINDNGVVRALTRTDQIEFLVAFALGTASCALFFGPRRVVLEPAALRVFFGPFHLDLPYGHVCSVERGRWMFRDALLVRFSRFGPFLRRAAIPLDSDGQVAGTTVEDFRSELLRRSEPFYI